jgi:hypothetical protein
MLCPAATHSLADSQLIIMCFSSRVPYSFFTLFLSLFGYQIWIGINFLAEHCLPMHLAMQPNEGKDIVNANLGLVNQALMRLRKAGDDQSTAAKLAASAMKAAMRGNEWYVAKWRNAAQEEAKVVAKGIGYVFSRYLHKERLPSGGIVLRTMTLPMKGLSISKSDVEGWLEDIDFDADFESKKAGLESQAAGHPVVSRSTLATGQPPH